jgi:hypothetical protein
VAGMTLFVDASPFKAMKLATNLKFIICFQSAVWNSCHVNMQLGFVRTFAVSRSVHRPLGHANAVLCAQVCLFVGNHLTN